MRKHHFDDDRIFVTLSCTQMTSITRTCIFTQLHASFVSCFHLSIICFFFLERVRRWVTFWHIFWRDAASWKKQSLCYRTRFSQSSKKEKKKKERKLGQFPRSKKSNNLKSRTQATNGLLNLCDLPILIACLDCLLSSVTIYLFFWLATLRCS